MAADNAHKLSITFAYLETMMDNVKTTRLFPTVVQFGSLSGASRQTGLSPASVSRQITALEEDFGFRLLNRTTGKLTLTEPGQVYLEPAERLVQDIDELRDAISQLAIRTRGTLRIQSRTSLCMQLVAPLIPSFLEQYPDLITLNEQLCVGLYLVSERAVLNRPLDELSQGDLPASVEIFQ